MYIDKIKYKRTWENNLMHKVHLIARDDPTALYEIHVHPGLITDWIGQDKYSDKLIWMNNRPRREAINGKEVELIEISQDVLNSLSRGEIPIYLSIIFEYHYSYYSYLGRNPLTLRVDVKKTPNINVSASILYNSYYYILLDYNVPLWYMELSERYQQKEQENSQLQKRIKELEHELLHEKYRPGGSGYDEAKEEFDKWLN